MIDCISSKMTDCSVNVSCLLGSNLPGSGLSALPLGGNERPTKAPAAAAETTTVRAAAYAADFGFAAAGAGAAGRQKTQHELDMWAFRGLNPWRYPA